MSSFLSWNWSTRSSIAKKGIKVKERKFSKWKNKKNSFKGQQKTSFYFIELKSCILLMLGCFRYHKVFHQIGFFLRVLYTVARRADNFFLFVDFFSSTRIDILQGHTWDMWEKWWKTGKQAKALHRRPPPLTCNPHWFNPPTIRFSIWIKKMGIVEMFAEWKSGSCRS